MMAGLVAVMILQVLWMIYAYQQELDDLREADPMMSIYSVKAFTEVFRKMWPLMLASLITFAIFIVIVLQLIRFLDEQEMMKNLRNDFSYAMVHDMKSPLSSIIMGTHFLHSGKVDDKPVIKEKYFNIVEEEAEHLLQLVNKLLTISKLENQKLFLNKQETEIAPVLRHLISTVQAKAQKPVRFSEDLRAGTLLTEEDYFKEVLSNLIDNSVKYSGESVHIHFESWENDKYVLLSVRDNGIGISKEDQKVIFDKFERAAIHERNRRGGVSGFGLGLNYVDQVMKAHGGKVTVQSEKDKYTVFTLFFPKKI